ncbi:DUF167 domain-containing protein, partial [Mycolicibacterium fortuitum]|uniref:DUF167 domain-containing protein n=1 Tax=Mycolicibacterium fortuitum TaxID=1766 RepID=UPI00399BA0BD
MSETVVVRVKPGSRKGPLVEVDDDGALTLYVQERAVDGKANDAVTKLLAQHLGVPRPGGVFVYGGPGGGQRFWGRSFLGLPAPPRRAR